jgi:hypothetical protein
VARNFFKAHGMEQSFEFASIRVCEFDELEPVGASYIEVIDFCLWGVVRERSHFDLRNTAWNPCPTTL